MLIHVPPVTNTDDFIWRLVKGCIQLGLIPDINNTVNMVPVDHVARCTALSALDFSQTPHTARVLHIRATPPVRFNAVLSAVARYGYKVKTTEYLIWRRGLEQHVLDVQDNALFPLLHFVLDDLPTSTKAPELDDRNTTSLLKAYDEVTNAAVDDRLMGLYLAWLVDAGFLDPPLEGGSAPLPKLNGVTAAKAIGRRNR